MEQQVQERSDNLSGCFLRMVWLVLGNMGLFFSFFSIAFRPGPFLAFSAADIVFSACVAAMAVARAVDIGCMHGTTASGKPATKAVLGRYVAILIAAAACAWAAAHGIAALQA